MDSVTDSAATMTHKPTSMIETYGRIELAMRDRLRISGIALLRMAIGIVFVCWFGALKVTDHTPVLGMVQAAYPFMPEPFFMHFLGAFEIVIGVGLISGIAFRTTLVLFLGQMLGTQSAPLMKPSLFFSHKDLFLLTTEGEFVVKNIVLITAGLVIAAYALQPIDKSDLASTAG